LRFALLRLLCLMRPLRALCLVRLVVLRLLLCLLLCPQLAYLQCRLITTAIVTTTAHAPLAHLFPLCPHRRLQCSRSALVIISVVVYSHQPKTNHRHHHNNQHLKTHKLVLLIALYSSLPPITLLLPSHVLSICG
jgi:hypothetical protein